MAQTRAERQRTVKKTQAVIGRSMPAGVITNIKGRTRVNKKAYPGKYGYGPEVRIVVT